MLEVNRALLCRFLCQLDGLVEGDSEPLGQRGYQFPLQRPAARQGVDCEARVVGGQAGDGHGQTS
jgi:hypothetical protein